jgi:hypothetical protein
MDDNRHWMDMVDDAIERLQQESGMSKGDMVIVSDQLPDLPRCLAVHEREPEEIWPEENLYCGIPWRIDEMMEPKKILIMHKDDYDYATANRGVRH